MTAGGTAPRATAHLLERLAAKVAGLLFLIGLNGLGGSRRM